MKNRKQKLLWGLLGLGILCTFLLIPEVFIANLISKNNPEVFQFYLQIMIIVTMFIYLITAFIIYRRYVKKYENEGLEKVNKELTSEFKEVLLNYSAPISEERFKCQAKVDDDGNIVCKIQLDYEEKLESFEEFLMYFHFPQD